MAPFVFLIWMRVAPHEPFQENVLATFFRKERTVGPEAESCHPFQLPGEQHMRSDFTHVLTVKLVNLRFIFTRGCQT